MSENITIVRAVYSGLSQRHVAVAHKVSRNTIALLLQHARNQGWLTLEDLKSLDEAALSKDLPAISTSVVTAFSVSTWKLVSIGDCAISITLPSLFEKHIILIVPNS